MSLTALSESDLKEYKKSHDSILQKLIEAYKQSQSSKAELVRRWIEVSEPLSHGILCSEPAELCNTLNKILEKNGLGGWIDYDWFRLQFPDHLKRKYDKSRDQDNFIELGKIADTQLAKSTNQKSLKFGGVIYDERNVQKKEEKIIKESAKTLLREELKQSLVVEAVRTSKEFLEQFISFLEKMEDKFKENPKILDDFEKSLEWKELADMCTQLQELYKDEGSIIRQMHQETNFRAPATMLQLALAKTLKLLDTHRNWAHKLSVSPRQYQRIRERLSEWPIKRASDVILKSLGSISCPNCRFNLVSKRKHPDFKVRFKQTKDDEHTLAYLGNTQYSLPLKFQKEGATPIRIATEIFLGKLKPIVK